MRKCPHGMHKTGSYRVWQHMKNRCRNPNHIAWHRYGGRGIRVCDRWQNFVNFYADMGDRPSGMQIDRIDNDGNYEPSNCRWVTPRENAENRPQTRIFNVFGEQRSIVSWADKFGLPLYLIDNRLRAGWTIERALSERVNGKNCG